MSTSSITHHRTTPYAAIAAAVVAIAAVVVLLQSGGHGTTVSPNGNQNVQGTSLHVKWHPTTAGGRVMVGE